MSNLSIFQFESHAVRTVIIEGEPWFVGKDVATVLGYSDPSTAIRSHCRGAAILHPISDAIGRKQEVRILSEPDMLRLVINCSLPAATTFEAWVFEEVLPSIRKTGKYSAPQVAVKVYAHPATQALQAYLEVAELFGIPLHLAQVEAVKEVRLTLGVDYSKVLAIAPAQQNTLLEEEALEPTELGKLLGLTAVKLNLCLVNAGLQVKDLEGWAPTEAGKPYASRHQWVKGNKSGYNLKWKRSVLKLLT